MRVAGVKKKLFFHPWKWQNANWNWNFGKFIYKHGYIDVCASEKTTTPWYGDRFKLSKRWKISLFIYRLYGRIKLFFILIYYEIAFLSSIVLILINTQMNIECVSAWHMDMYIEDMMRVIYVNFKRIYLRILCLL